MNGPVIYCIQYFPEKLEWKITRYDDARYALNEVFYFKGRYAGEWIPDEYVIYLKSIDHVSAFVIGVNKIEEVVM